jgi:hypothetical protein
MNPRAFALLLTCSLSFASAADELIELIESPNSLGPARTLDLRFTEEMIPAQDVPKGDAPSPITLTPAIAGKWTWQSTRSGVFSPTQPWPLATTVQIRPREGLTTTSGKPIPADWRRTLEMPAFAVQAWSNLSYHSEEDQSAVPRYALLFNAEALADGTGQSFSFKRAGGEAIPGKISATDAKNPGLSYFQKWIGPDRSLLTWTERFGAQGMAQGPRKNQLFVTPVKPLTPGDGWRLIAAAGIPAADGTLHTLNTIEIPVGTVKPFEIKSIEATNYLHQGRQLRITFNKAISKEFEPSDLGKWISISPAPENLEAKVDGSVVEYSGKFALEQEYRVAVEPGIRSDGPLMLASGKIEVVTFEPVPPRVYFEAFGTHQLSSGSRKFHLLAVNVPKLRVTAKLFTGTAIPTALRGYENYFTAPKDSEDESYSKVDADKLPGQLIWREEIAGTGALDQEREIDIDWTRMLGAERKGVVLVTAEALKQPGNDDPRPGAQAIVQLTDIGAVWKRSPWRDIRAGLFHENWEGSPWCIAKASDREGSNRGEGKV